MPIRRRTSEPSNSWGAASTLSSHSSLMMTSSRSNRSALSPVFVFDMTDKSSSRRDRSRFVHENDNLVPNNKNNNKTNKNNKNNKNENDDDDNYKSFSKHSASKGSGDDTVNETDVEESGSPKASNNKTIGIGSGKKPPLPPTITAHSEQRLTTSGSRVWRHLESMIERNVGERLMEFGNQWDLRDIVSEEREDDEEEEEEDEDDLSASEPSDDDRGRNRNRNRELFRRKAKARRRFKRKTTTTTTTKRKHRAKSSRRASRKTPKSGGGGGGSSAGLSSSRLEGAMDVIEHLARNISGVGYLSDLGFRDGNDDDSADGSIETGSSGRSSCDSRSSAASSKGAASSFFERSFSSKNSKKSKSKQQVMRSDNDDDDDDDDDDESQATKKKRSFGEKARNGIGKMIHRNKSKSGTAVPDDDRDGRDAPTATATATAAATATATADKPRSPNGALRRRMQQRYQQQQQLLSEQQGGGLQLQKNSQPKASSPNPDLVYSDSNAFFATFDAPSDRSREVPTVSPNGPRAKATTATATATAPAKVEMQSKSTNSGSPNSRVLPSGTTSKPQTVFRSSSSDVSNGTNLSHRYDNHEVFYDADKNTLRAGGVVLRAPLAPESATSVASKSGSRSNRSIRSTSSSSSSFRTARGGLFERRRTATGKRRSVVRMTPAGPVWDAGRSGEGLRPRRNHHGNGDPNSNPNPSASNHTSSSRETGSVHSEILNSGHQRPDEEQEVVVVSNPGACVPDDCGSRRSLRDRLGKGWGRKSKSNPTGSAIKGAGGEAAADRPGAGSHADAAAASANQDPVTESSFDIQGTEYSVQIQEVNASNYNSFLEDFARSNKNSTYVPDSDDDSSCSSSSSSSGTSHLEEGGGEDAEMDVDADADGHGNGNGVATNKCCLSVPRSRRNLPEQQREELVSASASTESGEDGFELALPERKKASGPRFRLRAAKTAARETRDDDRDPSSDERRKTRSGRKRRLRPERLLCGLRKREKEDPGEDAPTIAKQRQRHTESIVATTDNLEDPRRSPIPSHSVPEQDDVPPEDDGVETFRFTFSSDRNNNGILTEVPSNKTKTKQQQQQQKQQQKHDVNTSMETATTLGTQEEESATQIEVEELSPLSAPRISTPHPGTANASQPKPFPNPRAAGVSAGGGEDETKRAANAETTTTVPTTRAEKRTAEGGDDPSYAMDSARVFQDIAAAVKNTVASTLSGFVGDVMESTNHSRIPLSERVDRNDAPIRPEGEMLDAIYVPTSSMNQWDRNGNGNDDDEDANSDGENADSFPFLGSSISIAGSLPSISLDLDASILSWDLDTVFEMDRTQSKRDLDAALGGDLGQSKNDNDNPNPRQEQKQPTNNDYNYNRTAEGSGSNLGDNSIARSGDSTLPAYNSENATESKIRRGKRKDVSKTNKSDKHDRQFPILEDLPYRATKNQPVKERAVPNARSAMENKENETNFPRVGRAESRQHPVGVSRASAESKSLHSQKTAAAVIGENEANDDDIRSIDSLPFRPIVRTPPKRPGQDRQGDWETIENSASTRRTALSEKDVHQNPVALVRRTPPKPTERARGNGSSASGGTKNQLPAPTKATGRIDFAASGRAGVKANEPPNSSSGSNTKKNNNYVVDRNGFLVDTTTAVLEDLEKSFETNQQDTRKQGPPPSPQFGGDGKPNDHGFSPPAPYWKSMTKTDPATEYRAGPVPSREKR